MKNKRKFSPATFSDFFNINNSLAALSFFSGLWKSSIAPLPRRRIPVRVMTLGNMRENGVHSLAVTCGALWCHHEAVLDVTAFADDVTVPSFCLRMVCTVCGAIGADARPNWNERAPRSLFGPSHNQRS